MSLALATLLYEWRRYTAAVVALAFSGLLILAQVGMFTGIVRGITATIDRSRADIMILSPKLTSLVNGGNAGVPARVRPQIYLNPNVAEVEPLGGGGASWSNNPAPGQQRKTEFVQVWTVDTRPGAVTLPIDYTEATRQALMEPYAVAVDRTSLSRLGVKLNDSAVMNGRTVRVRAVLENYPSINSTMVVMSRETHRALRLANSSGPRTGPLMVSLKDPSQAEAVRDQLNVVSGGAYRAWTRAELSRANEGAIVREQIIGVFLGFSAVLGFLIGVGITSQTLRGAILANIKELASLRALGVSIRSLRLLVVELSAWVGLAGLIVTGMLTWVVTLIAHGAGLPLAFPPLWIAAVGVLLLIISLASGLFALGVLKKSQPADLLR